MTSKTVNIGNYEDGYLIEFKDNGDIIVKNEIIKNDKKLTDMIHESFESIFKLKTANELIEEIYLALKAQLDPDADLGEHRNTIEDACILIERYKGI